MVLTLSVANSIVQPEMTLQLVLQLPSGLLVSGEGGIGDECSVQCVGIYEVGTGENKDFLLSAVANQPGSFDIDGRMEWYFGEELDETQDGDVETLRIDVVAPQLPPTPTPTPTPTPEPTLPPHVGQPTVNLHTTQTEVQLGDPVRLQVSVVNSIAKPEMTLKLIMQVPSGWSMSGSGFTESCTGQCTATYEVASGDQRSIEFDMQPNQVGSFTAEAQMEWWFDDDVSTLDGKAVSLPMVVIDPSAPVPGPEPTAVPAPTVAVAPPPFTPSGSDNGGCNSLSGSGPGSLVLLALLILPVVGLVARPLLSRGPVPREALTPFDWVSRLVLVGPGQAINSANDSPFRKSLLVLLVVEAVALSLLALIIHFLWSDVPDRSNFTVLIWPLATLIVLGTVSLLGRPSVPVIFLGVPLAFWMGMLLLLHLSQFALGDPSMFYASSNWRTLTPIVINAVIAWLSGLRDKLAGRLAP